MDQATIDGAAYTLERIGLTNRVSVKMELKKMPELPVGHGRFAMERGLFAAEPKPPTAHSSSSVTS